MPRKAEKKAADAADAWDKVFAQVDPEVLLAGTLGAIAAKGGITPPFTSLLMSLSGDEGIAEKLKDSWMKVAELGSVGWMAGDLTLRQLSPLIDLLTGNHDSGATDEEKKKAVAGYAVMASGAFEAMLMMTFAKNPEFQKAVYDMMSGGISGLGAIAKAL